jgi:4-diphosphocytidyl-2-C-methyl-D-erythritol kinase
LLNRRGPISLGVEALAAIGRPLGADVPMCVHSRPLIARGIGEQIDPVARMPELALVLVCPPVAVGTADVFQALGALGGPLPPVPAFSSVGAVCDWLRATRNDLAAPAARVAPEAGAAATLLARDPRCLFARMTGSGPAAFGIFPSRAIADQAAAEIAGAKPGWWVKSTTTGGS